MNKIREIINSRDWIKKWIIPAVVCALIPFVLECTLFNMRFYQSRGYKQVTGMAITPSPNLQMRDMNVFEVISRDETPYVDVAVDNLDIKNVYVDVWPNNESFNADRLRFHYHVTDEGNPLGYDMPEVTYVRSVMQSMYQFLDLSGKCTGFRIYFDEGLREGELLRIENISFNLPIKFDFSKKRFLALTVILMLLYFFRPTSDIYRKKALESFKGKKTIIVLTLAVQAVLMWNISHLNGASRNPIYRTEHQFEMMAEALANGQTYLMEEPPKELVEMEHPYRFQSRYELGIDDDMYDVAFYKGHYYVYFGVGPIVLFYLPYYLLTGNHITTVVLMFIIGVLTAGGWMMLLYEMIKKYFRKFSFALYIVCSVLFTAGCGLTYVISRPSFYAIPMTMGLVCTLYGLAFWLKSIRTTDDTAQSASETKVSVNAYRISPACIGIGSLFMAFVAACRPQFLLGSFIAVIIFFRAVFKDRKLFSRESIAATVSFVMPYVIIAALLMYYNAVRFGSPFDFGANYNLTFNDMTLRGFRLNRTLYATLGVFFMPAKVTNSFPYFTPVAHTSRYMGYGSEELLLGGLFYNHLYLLSIVFIPKARKLIKDKGAFLMAAIMPVLAVVVSIVDANMAGVLNRYYVDFTWFIIIPFFILLGYVITADEMSQYRKIIAVAFYALAIMSLVHMFFMIFGGDVNGLENNAITTFQKVQHMIEFWD